MVSGCGQNESNSDSCNTMQELYYRSIVAREYADERFKNYLKQFDSKCEILDKSYGFYKAETFIYVVGYKYSNGISNYMTYSYKISVDNKKTCKIIEEGTDVAQFLFEE